MEISEKDWNEYIKKLSRIRNKSTQMMDAWIQKNGIEDVDAMVEYGRYLTDRYGAAASELSCEMYDEIAERAGVVLPPAVPAQGGLPALCPRLSGPEAWLFPCYPADRQIRSPSDSGCLLPSNVSRKE